MSLHHEKQFEHELCEHLAANGWLYSPTDAGYDKARALFAEDVFGWLADTQPDELAKVVKAGTAGEARQREQLLDRIRKILDTPHTSGGGTINVLRSPVSHLNARFQLAQFRPDSTLNAKTLERYALTRVRVMRQVHYSTQNNNSVDLALFINGIPVATLELKTDFTQSVAEAIRQYQHDRPTKAEPLLTPISGALVHFAVSNSDVYMTTDLRGPSTRFLPFNLGHRGGSGNPPNPHGSATSYLWERILDRDTWLDIIGKFLFVTTETKIDPISGERRTSTRLVFPRLHQWNAVTRLIDATLTDGVGERYLIQHSAGSGKTNTISWTAHRLSKLHDADNRSVFDSVIVITDRTVLDDQLQEAIRQIDPTAAYVATIDDKAIRDAGEGAAKSTVLANELLKGTRIIVVTIQTFPHAMQAIRENEGLAHKRFAVVADEAHSSQTGQTANKLRAVLSAEELAVLEDGGEIDVEAALAAETAARAESKNISYYAFTATPKAKTLELFGRRTGDGPPAAFDVYTMKHAIEEGFILDVLRGYQTYDLAFQIAQRTNAGDAELVDQSAATKGLVRWVALHPTNIAQRVGIVVEHFRANVAGLLDGHAKAMVVTESRKAAVRFKIEIDKYIAQNGYDIGTLVAFSGTVEDPEYGPDPFSESNMNPDLRGRDLAAAFGTDEFQIMLVANKYQTGFDQPLLCAMYVFKRLAGVATVQTLSRLNRTYTTPSGEPKKTMVLDFVNDPEDVRKAFEPYYLDARIDTETDPNIVHDLVAKLDQAHLCTPAEIEEVARIWVTGADGRGNNALSAAITPGQQRFRAAYQAALGDDDKTEIARLDLFRHDLGAYVRVYDFMSQIIDYGNPDLEKRAIFYRLLEPTIREENYTVPVDLSGVTLRAVKQIDRGVQMISLGTDAVGLRGMTAAGTRGKHDPKLVALQEVIDRLNELFGDEAFTGEQRTTFVEGLLRTLLADEQLVQQVRANTKKQFLESPHLLDGILDAVADNQDANNKIADVFFSDSRTRNEIVRLVGAMLYEWARPDSPSAQL